MTKRQSNLILVLTITGVVFGILLGLGLNAAEPSAQTMTLIGFPGELFVGALKMLIVPLVVASIIVGVASLGSLSETGKIGMRTVVYYFVTTIIAATIGLVLVNIIQPGVGAEALNEIPVDPAMQSRMEAGGYATEDASISTLDRVLNVFRTMVPDNIVAAAANLNVLGLIVFSILFGLALTAVKDKGKPVLAFFEGVNEAIMKLVMWFMWVVPIGIASLIAHKLGTSNTFWEDLQKLGSYAATVLIALAIHFLVVLPGIYWFVTRRNPVTYIRGVLPALFTALGTSSSSATLPVTIECVIENNGVSRKVSEFVLPVGATINMDGTAIYEAVSVIWIAQMMGFDLGLGGMITVVAVASLAAVGAAAIPSAGLITMLMVLSAVGIPLYPTEDSAGAIAFIAYIWLIDWFLDRCRTSVNVGGDSIGAAVIDELEQRDDKKAAVPAS